MVVIVVVVVVAAVVAVAVVVNVECYCFFLLIIIDEGAGDDAFRFVLLKPALSDVMFKLLL